MLAAGWVVVFAEAAFVVVHAKTLYDEGGYLYEGWLVCARGWRPYQDFYTKVTPLLYYFYGLPQALLGPSLWLGRLQATATALLAIALGSWAVARRCGPWAAAAAVWLFAATTAGLDQHFRALAIAPCALWTAVALAGIAHSDRRWGPAVAGAGVGLLLLTRHDLIGMALGLVFGMWLAGGLRAAAVASSIAAAVLLAGLAPFLVSAPCAVLRIVSVGLLCRGPEVGPQPFVRTEPLTLHNLPWYVKFLLRAYFAVGLALLAAAWRKLSCRAEPLVCHPVATTALVAALANLAVRGTATVLTGRNAFYLRDFYIELPLVVAAAGLLSGAIQTAHSVQFRRAVAAVAVAGVVLGPVVSPARQVFVPNRPPVAQAAAEAGKFVAAHTRPDDRIFTIADPHIFLLARREVLPRLTHHMFLYAPEADTAAVRKTWCFNLETLLEMLRHDATVVVLTERGMRWLVDNERTTAGIEVDRAVRKELRQNWRLVARADNPFAGRIEVFRRKTETKAPRL